MLNTFNFFKIPPFFLIIIFVSAYVLFAVFMRQKMSISIDYLVTLKYAYFHYGYILVFIGALLEGNLFSGFFVTGSVIVLLGAAFAREGVLSFPVVVLTATIGFTLAYVINYFIGVVGWYRLLEKFGLLHGVDVAKEKLETYGLKAFFIGTIFPGSAVFISTTAGIVKYPFTHFLLFIFLSQLFWTLVWCSIAYLYGLHIIEFLLKQVFLLPLTIVVIAIARRYL